LIVVDASAALDFLVEAGPRGEWARAAIGTKTELAAPQLIDLEVTSGLRKAVTPGDLTPRRARDALGDFESLALLRYSLTELLQRIWALRSSLTPYDAAYVVLAELLEGPLVTTDSRLARAHGHHAEIKTPPA
jgi:predicted nucleic acid-binding protein